MIVDFGFAAIPAITVVCYLVAEAVKATPLDNKFVPIICGAVGGMLGVLGVGVIAGFPAADPITAGAVGIVSGFAATGVNQVWKQLNG